MSYTIIRPRDHQEWLKYRESGIGSSEVGTILGLNPFDTPYQLWRRKMGIDPPVVENFAMKAGHYLEDAVSMFFSDATGYAIDKDSAGDWLVVSDAKPYLRVSPDRLYTHPDFPQDKAILECKTTQRDIDKDDVPQHWFCQLQYQLGVAELQYGSLAWLIAGRKFDYKSYKFDSDFFGYIVEIVERFWVDNILGKREPDSINVDDIVLRNPRHVTGKQVQASEQLVKACDELKGLKHEIDVISARKKDLENDIKMAMADAEALVTPAGEVLSTWKTAKDSTKFDEKRFAAECPEKYKQYLITQPGTRRFIVK